MDYNQLVKVLADNANKNFVRRILNPEAYPKLNIGNGQHATHLMSWGESDGKYIVFPQVQYEKGELKDYGDAAFDRAMQKRDYIQFDNPKDAEWFSKNYKMYWDKTGKQQ